MAVADAYGQDHAFLGVFEDPISIQGGLDVRCPTCGRESKPDWSYLNAREGIHQTTGLARGTRRYQQVALDWMRCAWEECQQLIVRIHDSRPEGWINGTGAPLMKTDTWIAYPRFGEATRPVDALVPESYKTHYLEAAALLDISPRMSAVLSRSIFADLLETCVGLTDYGLNDRINKFREKSGEPQRLRDGAHHFREIGDFGSHTQKNDQDQVIPVDREDADWMLGYLDRFLEYYVVAPAKDSAVLGKWDKNIADAGRKPIPPLAADDEEAT